MARIVVCGYMIRHPVAGNLLAYFHYVLGLHRLGHKVLYLEESGWPNSCYNPLAQEHGDDPRAGIGIVRSLMADYDLNIPICYINRDTGDVIGEDWNDVKRMLASADLLLNIGGVCQLPEFQLCRRRALIDMDPLFTQIGMFGGAMLDGYHVHFSYGTNIGHPGCPIPTGGIDWRPTVPPVVLDVWDGARPPAEAPFTTVANWNAYGGVTYQGEHYGQKNEEFVRLMDLPSRTPQRLELAISGAGETVISKLMAAGWSVRDGGDVSSDMTRYQAYIKGSRGELSAAKHAYVKTHSGWFSDRTVCYLAAGLPAILQDTGFCEHLPHDRGVMPFSSVEEAADCIERVNMDHEAHRRAARESAERTFSHDIVLPQLLGAALARASSYPAVVHRGALR